MSCSGSCSNDSSSSNDSSDAPVVNCNSWSISSGNSSGNSGTSSSSPVATALLSELLLLGTEWL
jgi:hypothetical protein